MTAMPLYDVGCVSCGHEFEACTPIGGRHNVICERCGGATRIEFRQAPKLSIFKVDWYEHIAEKPIHCSTPQELRQACDRHGVRSHYLEEGVWKTSPDKAYEGTPRDSGEANDPVLQRRYKQG